MACLATLKRGHELDNYGQPFDLRYEFFFTPREKKIKLFFG